MVNAFIMFSSSNTWAAGELIQLTLYKGVAAHSHIDRPTWESNTTAYKIAHGSSVILLAAGDEISIHIWQTSGAALTLYNNGLYNYVAISKIG